MAQLHLMQLPKAEPEPILPEGNVFVGIPGNFGIILYDADVYLALLLEVDNEEGEVLGDFFRQLDKDSTLSFSPDHGMNSCRVKFSSVLHLIERKKSIKWNKYKLFRDDEI